MSTATQRQGQHEQAPDLRTDGVLRPRPGEEGAEHPATEAFLPTATVQSHAANLTRLPGGDLACVWFGGTQEGVADIDVWMSRLGPDRERWSEPVRLSGDPQRSEQNPVLFVAPSGRVHLFHTAQRSGHQDTAEVRERVSEDGGQSFGPVRTLLPADEGGGVFVRQPPVVLPDGRWLLPVFRCVATPGRAWVGDADTSAVLLSDDDGASWSEHAVPGSTGCVHMDVEVLADGSLVAFFRSRWADAVHVSRSGPDATSWTVPEPTAVPNNNSSIQVTTLADGRLAMVANPSSRADATARRTSLYDEIDDEGVAEAPAPAAGPAADGEEGGERTAFWGAPRAPLSLLVSADGGRSWPVRRDLELGDGYCLTNDSRSRANRELSYPSVLQAPDGSVDVAFTFHRRAIKHVNVPLERLAP